MRGTEKNERVTDTLLSRSIMSSVIGIVLCMLCLCGTTWAWYSLSVISGENLTVGGNFDFDAVIAVIDIPVTPDESGEYSFIGGETATMTLSQKGTAKKGCCQILAKTEGSDAATAYYLPIDFSDGETQVTFTVTGAGTLKLTPLWSPVPEGGILLTPVLLSKPEEIDTEEEEVEEPEPEDETEDETETEDPTEPTEETEESTDPTEQTEQVKPEETPAA